MNCLPGQRSLNLDPLLRDGIFYPLIAIANQPGSYLPLSTAAINEKGRSVTRAVINDLIARFRVTIILYYSDRLHLGRKLTNHNYAPNLNSML